MKNSRSPVALWLRSRFPHHKQVQTQFRVDAGTVEVSPASAVAVSTQGAAIDWWIRFVVDPAPSVELAASGIERGRARFGPHPCFDIGAWLLEDLGGVSDRVPQPVDPTRVTGRDDEWQARVCYALALLVEPLRASTIEGSRLIHLDQCCGIPQLLALATDAEVTDLIAMRDLARQHLLPALPPGPVATGPTFDGSRPGRAAGGGVALR